jgi:hypothetical protein
MSITVKVAFNEGIRRFCLPETISFAEFIQHIGKLFKVDDITVKYVDDEGDSIVVTSDEELTEAFRLAKELKPPILRVTVQAVAVAVKKTEVVIVEKTILPPAAETSQYPPLDVAFWDAPAKTAEPVVAAAPTVLPAEPCPIRIAQQMTDHCVSTSRSVSQCSRDTTTDTLKYSDQTRLQVRDSGLVNSTVALCSDLSRQIAADCRLLSLQTAAISRTLGAAPVADVISDATFKNNLNEMTSSVVSVTNRLSAETAQMCRNLAQATSLSTLSY